MSEEKKIITRKEAKELGLSRFYTGKVCRRGHFSERYTASGNCISCRTDNTSTLSPIVRVTEEKKKESASIRSADWYRKNKDLVKIRAAKWKSENRDAVRASSKKYDKKLYSTTSGKTIRFMRDSIRRCLINKIDRTESTLGYTKSDLSEHISALFEDGMTWDNHGEWHIDHIVPLSWFVKAGVNDPKVINKLTNLRPIWSSENHRRWRP